MKTIVEPRHVVVKFNRCPMSVAMDEVPFDGRSTLNWRTIGVDDAGRQPVGDRGKIDASRDGFGKI